MPELVRTVYNDQQRVLEEISKRSISAHSVDFLCLTPISEKG